MYTEKELLEWNARGLIPGPQESTALFIDRARLRTPTSYPSWMQEPLQKTRKLFDIAPDWLEIGFSHRLAPWHGAVCILGEKGRAQIKLPSSLQKKRRLWGLYLREEIVAHEMIHSGRFAFNEPKYEELLATMGSSLGVRILRGSFSSPWQVWLLLASSCLPPIAFLLESLEGVLMGGLFSIALIFSALLRSRQKVKQLDRCLERLSLTLGDHTLARAVLYRLTDQEIDLFACLSCQEIQDYARAHQEKELRWKGITLAYLR